MRSTYPSSPDLSCRAYITTSLFPNPPPSPASCLLPPPINNRPKQPMYIRFPLCYVHQLRFLDAVFLPPPRLLSAPRSPPPRKTSFVAQHQTSIKSINNHLNYSCSPKDIYILIYIYTEKPSRFGSSPHLRRPRRSPCFLPRDTTSTHPSTHPSPSTYAKTSKHLTPRPALFWFVIIIHEQCLAGPPRYGPPYSLHICSHPPKLLYTHPAYIFSVIIL